MNPTVGRVRKATAEEINQRIRIQTEASVAYYAAHPEQISERLKQLDEEWDIERAIEVESASMIFTGVLLGSLFSRKWYVIPAVAASMLLVHNVRGPYPLLPVFRRMGIRSQQEIAHERYALKAIRGDFETVPEDANNPEQAEKAFEAAYAA